MAQMKEIEEKLGDPKWEGCCRPTSYQPELCHLAHKLYFAARMANYHQKTKTTLDLFACRSGALKCQKHACRGVFTYLAEMSDCVEKEIQCYRVANASNRTDLQEQETIYSFAAYIGSPFVRRTEKKE